MTRKRRMQACRRWSPSASVLRPVKLALAFNLAVAGSAAALAATTDDDAFRRAIEGGNKPPAAPAAPQPRARKARSKPIAPKEACDATYARLSNALAQTDKFYLQKCFYDERCDQAEKCVWYRQEFEFHQKLRGVTASCQQLPNREQEFARFSHFLEAEPYARCVQQQ